MASRLKLQEKLQSIIGLREDNKPNVYFQPPESVKLNYPCFVYHRDNLNVLRADNKSYRKTFAYQIMYITQDPDDPLITSFIDNFEMCRYNRHFTASNLNHEVFTVYY